MIRIPETVKIGNLVYKVSYEDDEAFEKCGQSSLVKQYIRLNQIMSPELQFETLLHEVIHQILGQKSFKDENRNEPLIDTLSAGLYQLLKDNPFLKEVK